MDEQYQQLEAGPLPLAALATAVAVADAEHREIVRIAQAAQRAIGTSYASDRLPYLHRIVRNAFPDRDFSRERWRAILTGPEPAQEEEPERTCTCTACEDVACQGDCDMCHDHRCEQCYDGHRVYTCCGYCTECDSHPDGYDDGDHNEYRCGECGYCRDCEHSCE